MTTIRQLPNSRDRFGNAPFQSTIWYGWQKPLSDRRPIAWMLISSAAILLSGAASSTLFELLSADGLNAPLWVSDGVSALTALRCYALMVRFGEHRVPTELMLKDSFKHFGFGSLCGVLVFSSVMLMLYAVGSYSTHWIGWSQPWQAFGEALRSSVTEELVARGVILRLLRRLFGTRAAFLISSSLFGAFHLINPNCTCFSAVCVGLEAGTMLGALYLFTRSLWAPIGMHFAWNFTQSYIFGLPVSGNQAGSSVARSVSSSKDMQIWTGGPFGPEASIAALILCLSFSAVLFTLVSGADNKRIRIWKINP